MRNGKVLVAGGTNDTFLASAELYDPATGLWSTAGNLFVARAYHTATFLLDGKVLLVGGVNDDGLVPNGELYDSITNTWTNTGSMVEPRQAHTATLLPNGSVLVAGGDGGTGPANAEIYDPITGL